MTATIRGLRPPSAAVTASAPTRTSTVAGARTAQGARPPRQASKRSRVAAVVPVVRVSARGPVEVPTRWTAPFFAYVAIDGVEHHGTHAVQVVGGGRSDLDALHTQLNIVCVKGREDWRCDGAPTGGPKPYIL